MKFNMADKNYYRLTLSSQETEQWSKCWPCSTIGGKSLTVIVDSNGIESVNKAMENVDTHELEAIVADFLPKIAQHLWPVWKRK
jgi:hypothetical protein